ncbi:MAG: hypothetical protein MUO72_14920 [Bacteroidales bacterium]|nr:hypothetical protein [Bacteroidales bacterium]
MEALFNEFKKHQKSLTAYSSLLQKMNFVFSEGVVQNNNFGKWIRKKIDPSDDTKFMDYCSNLESFVSYVKIYKTFDSLVKSEALRKLPRRLKEDFIETIKILSKIYFVSDAFNKQNIEKKRREIKRIRKLENIIKDSITE